MTNSDQTEPQNKSNINGEMFPVFGLLFGFLLSGFIILIIEVLAEPKQDINFNMECWFIIFSMLLFAGLGWSLSQLMQLIKNTMTLLKSYLIAVFLPAFLAAIISWFSVFFAPIIAVLTIIAKIFQAKFKKDKVKEEMPKWIEKALDLFIPGAIASGLATLYVFGFHKIFPTIEFINVFNKINLCNLFKH